MKHGGWFREVPLILSFPFLHDFAFEFVFKRTSADLFDHYYFADACFSSSVASIQACALACESRWSPDSRAKMATEEEEHVRSIYKSRGGDSEVLDANAEDLNNAVQM